VKKKFYNVDTRSSSSFSSSSSSRSDAAETRSRSPSPTSRKRSQNKSSLPVPFEDRTHCAICIRNPPVRPSGKSTTTSLGRFSCAKRRWEEGGGYNQQKEERRKEGRQKRGKKAMVKLWVETNQSNFRIYPTDIHLLPPHGTTLTAYADVRTDVGRC